MKAKHLFVGSFFFLLTAFMLHTPKAEAGHHHRHHSSSNVRFNFGFNFMVPPPVPCYRETYRETYVVEEYRYYPQRCHGPRCQRYVVVQPQYEEVVYLRPVPRGCPHCR
ncbi:MAG TPA: hypothetical protein VIJ14_08860 [Rhabdochlamydiaceae bacterium]